MIPARFKVIVTRRPKYACRECDGEVAQAPAPEHLIEGGIPTEALIAAVVIAKYADHLPLYRQAQIYGRQGVELDRSTLADWSGRAAFARRPMGQRRLRNIAVVGGVVTREIAHRTSPAVWCAAGNAELGKGCREGVV